MKPAYQMIRDKAGIKEYHVYARQNVKRRCGAMVAQLICNQ